MKRYTQHYDQGEGILIEDAQGAWIRYEDVLPCLKRVTKIEYMFEYELPALIDIATKAKSAEEFWLLIREHREDE